MKRFYQTMMLCGAALAAFTSTANAQTEQKVTTNSGTVKAFVTDLVLNGNNVVLKFEDKESATYKLLSTGIDLSYDETLAITEMPAAEPKADGYVYDLQGRRMNGEGWPI